ncbi:hypothetical protein [Herpetosiphon geysericola]|uniref:Uncharacterized protein n=1 Tax=Herpetosiphon geysericola TaxID=70996 RepID=A0A0P6XZ70_9CHLR|nr:hypothetical protein [Herpetosiphon geysericola]KPL88901.1 hypothetical protein SE18_09550 [Herpetosiphon geysericola]
MLEPPLNPQQRANVDSTQGYRVPTAPLTNLNQPNRWKCWVAVNGVACIGAIILFPIIGIMAIFIQNMHRLIFDQLASDNHLFFILGLGIMATLTAIPVAMIQHTAFGAAIPRRPWVVKSALTAGLLLPTSIFLAQFSLQSLNQHYGFTLIISLLIVFSITSFGTALIQGLEIQAVVEYPLDWVWISSLTWSSMSILLGSLLLALVVLL